MKKDYSRSMSLLCPVCAGDQFEFDDEITAEEREYHCTDCNTKSSYEDLMSANSARVDSEVHEIGQEIVKDATASLRKAFKGFK